ncbi:MAG: hypothetical protein LH630_06140 [Actinomycetia bacterium]|nr:hypothetical protein [Actinomycetes bacterium]
MPSGSRNSVSRISPGVIGSAPRRGNDVVRSDGPGTQTNTGRGDDKAHPGCNFGRVSAGPGDDTLHPVPDSFTADGGGVEDRAQVGSCWGRGLTIRLDSAGDAHLLDPFTDRDAGLDNFERLAATPWPDLIGGSKGADILAGRQGTDRLRGYRGDDRLLGGAGRDRLIGGLGSDRVNGGTGRFDTPDSCSREVVIGCELLI